MQFNKQWISLVPNSKKLPCLKRARFNWNILYSLYVYLTWSVIIALTTDGQPFVTAKGLGCASCFSIAAGALDPSHPQDLHIDSLAKELACLMGWQWCQLACRCPSLLLVAAQPIYTWGTEGESPGGASLILQYF
jgi:hypothetical protein